MRLATIGEGVTRSGALDTCLSVCGLKSQSWMSTVSAPTRLRPCPPARVDSRNAKMLLSWLYLHHTTVDAGMRKLLGFGELRRGWLTATQ
jgi:hypothetical protein